MASRFSPPTEAVSELRLVLLGKVGAGKSKVARLILGGKEPKGESGLCILRKGESAGRRITLVDTPGWDRNTIKRTSKNIKDEIVRSATLCPPGPHALILVLRVESTDVFSVKELKTVSQHMELLSHRVWNHTMVLFLCDEEVGNPTISQHTEKANRLLEKCGNRHYVLRSENQIPVFLDEIEKMVEENCGKFYLPQIYYEYMQDHMPRDVAQLKKKYEDREEQLKQGYQKRIHQYKKDAEEAALGQRRGSLDKDRPNMSEHDQPVDIMAIKTKYRDELLELARYYLKPVALLALVVIGALVGSVVGAAYGVMGAGGGIIIGIAVTIPLALWLIGAASLARDSSRILQVEHSTSREQTVHKRK